jgi:hypothetical protein
LLKNFCSDFVGGRNSTNPFEVLFNPGDSKERGMSETIDNRIRDFFLENEQTAMAFEEGTDVVIGNKKQRPLIRDIIQTFNLDLKDKF